MGHAPNAIKSAFKRFNTIHTGHGSVRKYFHEGDVGGGLPLTEAAVNDMRNAQIVDFWRNYFLSTKKDPKINYDSIQRRANKWFEDQSNHNRELQRKGKLETTSPDDRLLPIPEYLKYGAEESPTIKKLIDLMNKTGPLLVNNSNYGRFGNIG